MKRFVDSNVFIYHLAGDPDYGNRSTEIWKSIEKGENGYINDRDNPSLQLLKVEEGVIPIFFSLLRRLTSLEKIEITFIDFKEAREF